MPARGLPKNLGLTALIISPLAAVALLMWWIFASLAAGPAMNAPAVGAGANDTGGANAFGEELAGNDADAIQRINRALRAGELIDPARWPGGLTLTIADPGLPAHEQVVIAYSQTELTTVLQFMDRTNGGFSMTFEQGSPVPGTPIIVGVGNIAVVRKSGVMSATDGEGRVVAEVTLEPVPTEGLDDTQPLVLDLGTLGVSLTTD